jgi:hypothetical protein
MGFSFESNPNPNPQENGFSVKMRPACGREIPSSSESIALVKFAFPGSPMIVPDTTKKCKVYLHKDAVSAVNALQWALLKGQVPREIYCLDKRKQFISK